jgi:hypothetical protein
MIIKCTKRSSRHSPATVGCRKAPAPQDLPGYIHIDSVHKRDQAGMNGIDQVNAVDIGAQCAQAASVERIGEAYMLPLIALLKGFPFVGGRRRYERNPGVGFRNRRERLSVTLVRALN